MKKINSKKIKKGLKLVNQIQKIRSNNNKNWMDLLRLSLKLDFNTTSKIIKDIVKDDILNLVFEQSLPRTAKHLKRKLKIKNGIVYLPPHSLTIFHIKV